MKQKHIPEAILAATFAGFVGCLAATVCIAGCMRFGALMADWARYTALEPAYHWGWLGQFGALTLLRAELLALALWNWIRACYEPSRFVHGVAQFAAITMPIVMAIEALYAFATGSPSRIETCFLILLHLGLCAVLDLFFVLSPIPPMRQMADAATSWWSKPAPKPDPISHRRTAPAYRLRRSPRLHSPRRPVALH